MKESMRESIAKIAKRLNTGRAPYIVSGVLLVVGTLLVYMSPRSILAFLVFATSGAMVYFL